MPKSRNATPKKIRKEYLSPKASEHHPTRISTRSTKNRWKFYNGNIIEIVNVPKYVIENFNSGSKQTTANPGGLPIDFETSALSKRSLNYSLVLILVLIIIGIISFILWYDSEKIFSRIQSTVE